MASTIKKCRVCGREYNACRSANRSADVFRWQEVACSPECGTVYLERIIQSRKQVSESKKTGRKKDVAMDKTEHMAKKVFEPDIAEVVEKAVTSESDTSEENE